MSKDPLQVFEAVDPEALKVFNSMRNLAFSEGALSAKTKALIAMALDASAGATEGVVALARRAISLGATNQEVMEALRVACYGGCAGPMYTSAIALQTIVEHEKIP